MASRSQVSKETETRGGGDLAGGGGGEKGPRQGSKGLARAFVRAGRDARNERSPFPVPRQFYEYEIRGRSVGRGRTARRTLPASLNHRRHARHTGFA